MVYPRKYRIVFPAIDDYIRRNHITIAEMARRIGVSSQKLSNWLYGMNEPKLKDCKTLVNLTGIPFETLFNEKYRPPGGTG